MTKISKTEPQSHQKAALLLREKICDEFEQAVIAAATPLLENYLEMVGEDERPALLRELLLIELHHNDRHGQTPDFERYRRQFPLHVPLMDELFAEKHLWQYPSGDAAPIDLPAGREPTAPANRARRLHIRCPHCHEAMDVATDAPLTGVVCELCGSQFSLAGDDIQQAPNSLASIGHFELKSRIGVGGFGTVWRAVDTKLARVVAVKIPRSGQLDAKQQRQLVNEARAAAQLSHPNIVSVHEVGRDGDTIYIVSDFVNGVTLSDWLQARRPTRRECVEVCITIASALHHAHEAGVIHRDMKASNVLMDQDDEPRITDFGLAKREMVETTIDEDGKIFGTPAYMSPEQARGEGHHADRRSDVYALGVMLYQSLTEELPFRGNAGMLLHQVLNVEPPSPRKLDDSISRDLETICLKCLEKDPAKRYQTAKQLAEDLQRYIQGEPISARPISRPERTWRWCRRNPMAATAAALLTVIAVASPVIAVRERLHALESDKLNRENRKHIQQLTSERDKLRREATVPAEYLGFRQPGQISTGGRQFLRWAYDRYEPAMHEILRGAATPEERCMAALGLAILANQTKPPEDSLGLLLQARAELEQAAGSSANNLQLQAGLAFCYDSLGEVYGRLQEPDLDLAREYDEKAERVWRQLAQSDPTLANYRALAENQLNLAGHKRYEGSEAQVLSRLDQIEKTSQQHLDLFIPQSPRQLYEIACELAGCRPWLTHVPEAAVGVEVSADVDAPHK